MIDLFFKYALPFFFFFKHTLLWLKLLSFSYGSCCLPWPLSFYWVFVGVSAAVPVVIRFYLKKMNKEQKIIKFLQLEEVCCATLAYLGLRAMEVITDNGDKYHSKKTRKNPGTCKHGQSKKKINYR